MSELIYTIVEDTATALDGTVELIIAREHGAVEFEGRPIDEAIVVGRELAAAGIRHDARTAYEAFTGGDDRYLSAWVRGEAAVLIKARLVARECQCRRFPQAGLFRGHGHADLCTGHYETDVPPVQGLLLCGTCYGAEPEV
jgi:hypothetical protein